MQTAQVILCSIISKIKVGFRHSQLCEHGCYVESIKILADVLTTHITISRRFLIKAHLLPSVIASQGICQIVKIQLPSLDLCKKKKKVFNYFIILTITVLGDSMKSYIIASKVQNVLCSWSVCSGALHCIGFYALKCLEHDVTVSLDIV